MGHAVYRFGIFEVDTGAHALLKNGTRLPLQEQPFQVLLALVERPGQVITRETLRARLWGTDTFVDFDQSLNSTLRRLRLALEDDSRHPVYVETIPRVGFRFLPEVVLQADASALVLPGEAVPPVLTLTPVTSMPMGSAADASRQRYRGGAGAVAALTFLLGLLLGALPWQWKRADMRGVSASTRAVPGSRTETTPGSPEPFADLALHTFPVSLPPPAVTDLGEAEGWYYLEQRTQGDYVQAKKVFDRTLAAQPGDASAMVGLAQAEILMALNGDEPGIRLTHARTLGRAALVLSPHLAAAHTVVGAADALIDWNDAEAEQEFRTALHLQPNDSLTHLWYAVFTLMPRRAYRDAEAEANLAVREDPLSLIAHTNLGWILYTEGKREAAMEQYRFVLHLKPDFVPARFRVNQLLRAERQRPDPTLHQVAALMNDAPDSQPNVLLRTSEMARGCDGLRTLDSNDPQALAVLRVGVRERCLQAYFFGQDPELSKLQRLPEFAELANEAHPEHLRR